MARLFIYGELKPSFRGEIVQAPGELRLREDGDAAAKFGLDYQTLVRGKLVFEEDQHLLDLDRFEKPEYQRDQILLSDFRVVDAYVYIGKAWNKFKVIPSGVYKQSMAKKNK
jgi:gamma-glutamylcyclotransferase (GGCT)/AIG2-like uncharacterized protein YtfP